MIRSNWLWPRRKPSRGLWISHIVLLELSWVLESSSGRTRKDIADAFEMHLFRPGDMPEPRPPRLLDYITDPAEGKPIPVMALPARTSPIPSRYRREPA
jgi:hypothetical protein